MLFFTRFLLDIYAIQRSSKSYGKLSHVSIGSDQGSLRLQFSTEVSLLFYSKRQTYKEMGRANIPKIRQWTEGIARQIQANLDYLNGGLFDPRLVKYFDIKQLATIIPMPTRAISF